MAAITLKRDIRMAVIQMVSIDSPSPIPPPMNRLAPVTEKPTLRKSLTSKMRLIAWMRTQPIPMPNPVPSTAAVAAYMLPSMVKARVTWLRRKPMARRMPSWFLRSSASITNRFTMSKTPAMTAKLPMPEKRAVNSMPSLSASWRVSAFTSSTVTASRLAVAVSSSAVTASDSSAPAKMSPVFDTATSARGGRPSSAGSYISKIDPAATYPEFHPAVPERSMMLVTAKSVSFP